MRNDGKLIIIGDRVFAEVAYEFFTHDSSYEVVAFSVERDYLSRPTLFDLPIVAFEDLESMYDPSTHSFFVAVVFSQSNKLRTRLYLDAKARGYTPASYLSTRARIDSTAEVGEHCFICDDTVIQPKARIMENVVLWSSNFIGHHGLIKSNCFTLPHAVISAFAEVGANCVIGPNAAVLENVSVGDGCQIEAGALVSADVELPESNITDPLADESQK